jgi:hypothetical protein
LLAILPLVAVVGCGGDGDSDGSAQSNGVNGVESKPAEQIVRDSAAALKRVDSVRLEGTQTVDRIATKLKADLEPPASVRMAMDQRGASVTIIVVDGELYLKANAKYWKQLHAGRGAEALANRWVKAPDSSGGVRDVTKTLNVATLSRCLVLNHGRLSVAGKATVAGRKAVVVVDEGDRPGGTPGKLYVAAEGPPLPLRVIVTGRQRPGGKPDPDCNDPSSRDQPGDEITFSNYDKTPKITAPPGAFDLSNPPPAQDPA